MKPGIQPLNTQKKKKKKRERDNTAAPEGLSSWIICWHLSWLLTDRPTHVPSMCLGILTHDSWALSRNILKYRRGGGEREGMEWVIREGVGAEKKT
jgi:hypothetical protein